MTINLGIKKELNTLQRKKPFSYVGSVEEGMTIYFGAGREKTISKKAFDELRSEFKGKTVQIGTSFDHPPKGSLGAYLIEKISPTALASYLAPILISEGYAVQSDKTKMEITFLDVPGENINKEVRGTIEIDPSRKTISIQLENGHYCIDLFPNGVKSFLEVELDCLQKDE